MKHRLKSVIKRISRISAAKPQASVECYLDSVDGLHISGWAKSLVFPDRKCNIQLIANNVILGEATADIMRIDLARQGIGDGRYGYSIMANEMLLQSRVVECHLLCDGEKILGSEFKIELTEDNYREIRFAQTYSNQIDELSKLIKSNVNRLNVAINDKSFETNDDSLNVATGILVQEIAAITARLTVIESHLLNTEK